jgi:hypothetical protein
VDSVALAYLLLQWAPLWWNEANQSQRVAPRPEQIERMFAEHAVHDAQRKQGPSTAARVVVTCVRRVDAYLGDEFGNQQRAVYGPGPLANTRGGPREMPDAESLSPRP